MHRSFHTVEAGEDLEIFHAGANCQKPIDSNEDGGKFRIGENSVLVNSSSTGLGLITCLLVPVPSGAKRFLRHNGAALAAISPELLLYFELLFDFELLFEYFLIFESF